MGGVWERQIRSLRNVLSSLMEHCGSHLDDEMLRTFMCEAAAILIVDLLPKQTFMIPIHWNH